MADEEKQKKLKEIKHNALMAEMKMASDALGALIELNNSYPATSEKNARKSFKINKAPNSCNKDGLLENKLLANGVNNENPK
jgi:hypothetical protein